MAAPQAKLVVVQRLGAICSRHGAPASMVAGPLACWCLQGVQSLPSVTRVLAIQREQAFDVSWLE